MTLNDLIDGLMAYRHANPDAGRLRVGMEANGWISPILPLPTRVVVSLGGDMLEHGAEEMLAFNIADEVLGEIDEYRPS